MKFYLYHLRYKEDGSDTSKGYIGVTSNLRKRLTNHRCGNCSATREHYSSGKTIFDDVLFSGSEHDAYEMEKKLRPLRGMGWNVDAGGCVSDAKKGIVTHKWSDNSRRRASESKLGTTASIETKAKMSLSGNGVNDKIYITPDGKFDGLLLCAEYYGISTATVSRRCNGKVASYPDWRISNVN